MRFTCFATITNCDQEYESVRQLSYQELEGMCGLMFIDLDYKKTTNA
jgi:hypothetical protein